MNSFDFFNKGWVCPKCGAVMSPTTSFCRNCKGESGTYVSTGIGTNNFDLKRYEEQLKKKDEE